MTDGQTVDEAAWPHVLKDLERLGATPGEVLRVSEMVEWGLPEVALCLVDAALKRLRES